jgi:DNA-directed RNA polymerase subunit M/transcription elongation factor TFIIS
MIDVTCPQCHAVYHSAEAHVGKRLRCTHCGCLVPITDRSAERIVSVEAQRVQKHKSSGAKVSAKRAENPHSRRWPLYAGVFVVVVAAVAVSLFWHENRYAETKSPQTSAQASPSTADGTYRLEDIIDEVPHEKVSGNAISGQEPRLPSHEGVPKPDRRPTKYNSLPTGTRIQEDAGTNGNGELTVENGTTEDAVARLFEVGTDQTVRWFFAQAGTSAHVTRIPQGIYRLTFTTGLNWDESQDAFSWHPSYSEFERTFEYKEQRDSERVQYKQISVTLNPVAFGNVSTKAITREEFLKGHRHTALQR